MELCADTSWTNRQLEHKYKTDRSTSNKFGKSPPHEEKSAQKEVLRSDDCKMLYSTEFASFLLFTAKEEIRWHVTLKETVSIF
jgi:hypothetical protein